MMGVINIGGRNLVPGRKAEERRGRRENCPAKEREGRLLLLDSSTSPTW